MDTTTIILIIGALFLLIAIADSIGIQGNSLNLLNNKLRVPLGILGILLIGFGLFQSVQSNAIPESQTLKSTPRDSTKIASGPKEIETPKTSIKYPQNGDSIRCIERIKGIYPFNNEKHIWVLLKPEDNRYYPQSDLNGPAKKKNGEWKVTCRFGGAKNEYYDLIVYETNESASKFFSLTIDDWNKMDDYPGLNKYELPKGAKEIERIVVVSKDSCKGKH